MDPRELTPFKVERKTVLSETNVDPSQAKEVMPILLFGILPTAGPVAPQALDLRPGNSELEDSQDREGKSSEAETDPKVNANLSAIDNASSSEAGTSESGTKEQNADPMTLHPSSQSAIQEVHVNVEKGLNLIDLISS